MTRIDRIVLLVCALAVSLPAAAEEAGAPAQCWTKQALAGTEAELKHQPGKGPLDLAGLKATVTPAATPVPPDLRGSIRGVELHGGVKLIALTFDLCEENGYVSGYDGRIVDLLRAQAVKATFFAGGKWLETHPERAAQLIADPLFEIGGHGLRHRDLTQADNQTMKDEILLTEAAYQRARAKVEARQCSIDGAAPKPQERLTLLRFPYGRCNQKALDEAAAAGELAIQWDVVSGDPDPRTSAKAIAGRILAQAHPGAIVVAHANGRGRNTAAALAIALPKLKEQGYGFVTVSELIAAGKPVIATSCYMDRPGDSHPYPRVARVSGVKAKNGSPFSIFNSGN
jgi:peptidoglycan/xylan/chitin deacetylase (PgdA/CDA1 family)